MAKVLIVEDDSDSRLLLEYVVRSTGNTPFGLTDAESVEGLPDTVEYDLAILDINLPGENGVELAWHLRQARPGTPIIIVSGILEIWEIDDLIDCGADLVLSKPYDMKQLTCQIERLIEDGRTAASSSVAGQTEGCYQVNGGG